MHCLNALFGNSVYGKSHLLLEYVYIFLHADILKLLWPNRNCYLPKMSCAQQIHEGSGLSDASSNAEWNPVIDDCLVVWEVKKILLA